MTTLPEPTQTKNVLGVILARAGSKGLPGKHARSLLGRPVVDYSFDASAAARTVTRLVVSTDCPQVRRLAQQRFLQTIQRPADLATDTASVQDVLLHALDQVESRGGFRADAVVILYGNVAARPDGAIDRCVSHLFSTGCDSVRTFCPTGKFNPAWMSRLDGDKVQPLRPGSVHRRQDLEPVYLHDGACVAMTRDSLTRGRMWRDDPHAMFGEDRRGVIVGEGETVEIDTERDLLLAEAVLRGRGVSEWRVRMAA